jgi:hypothetical protein
MLRLNLHGWCALAVLVVLSAGPARAQTVAISVDEPRPVLKNLIPEARTLTEGIVTQSKGRDSLWNGALIGAAIGVGLATWDYFIDPSEPGNAAIFAVSTGLGTAVGAGIDALLNRSSKTLDASPQPARRVRVSPVLRKDRQGALVSIRF